MDAVTICCNYNYCCLISTFVNRSRSYPFSFQVPNTKRCFEHTVRRYYPVANLTRTRQAVIVEPLRPERFYVRTFNATSLYILSICEVCGSYQCPYCPFYSAAPRMAPPPDLAALATVAAAALTLSRSWRLIS